MNHSCKFIALLIAALTLGIGQAFAGQGASFLLPSGVQIEITEAPFDNTLFKVLGCSGDSKVCLVNGHVPFGTDFSLPKTYTKSITVSYQGKTYSLDVSNMYNAWGSRPLEVKGAVRYFGGKCFDTKNCQFRGLFSDAAGSFVAEWKVINGMPIRTVLTDSDDVVNLFMHNIDPPEFE